MYEKMGHVHSGKHDRVAGPHGGLRDTWSVERPLGVRTDDGELRPIELIDAILELDRQFEALKMKVEALESRADAIEAVMKPRSRVRPDFCLDSEEYAEQPRSDCEGVSRFSGA